MINPQTKHVCVIEEGAAPGLVTLAAGSADLLADKSAGRTSSLPLEPFTFKAA